MIVKRQHDFCAAHRIFGHGGKCERLHGHNYRVTFHIEGDIQENGMVVDFAEIKEKCCYFIDSHWDHRVMIWDADELAVPLKRLTDQFSTIGSVVLVPFNTTAENMATFLLRRFLHFGVVRVDMQETEKCSVTAKAPMS